MTTTTFKTARAAKIAMTKADKAYWSALNDFNVVNAGPGDDARNAKRAIAKSAVEAARLAAVEVFAAVAARGDVFVSGFGVQS